MTGSRLLWTAMAAAWCSLSLTAAPEVGDDTPEEGGAEAKPSVLGVVARQRYPWNGKVDIDCRVGGGTAGSSYALTVMAHDKAGGTNLTVRSVSVEGGAAAESNPVTIAAGRSEYRLVWDAGKDLPQGFKSGRVSVSVSVAEAAKKYLVIDLDSGAVTYMGEPPVGGFDTDEYKTTKMVFVRIEPQSYMQMESEIYGRKVTITKPFYISLYPATVAQKSVISHYINTRFVISTDVGNYTIEMQYVHGEIGLGQGWPRNDSLPASYNNYSGQAYFLPGLREKSGLRINLPTVGMLCLAQKVLNIQSEYAPCVDMWGDYSTQALEDPMGPVNITYVSSHDPGSRSCVKYMGGDMYHIKSTYSGGGFLGDCVVRFCIHDATEL